MTNQLYLYRLRFTTPLHIGNERADYASGSATVHSDALYAALFFTAARLGLTDLLPVDGHQFPFCISSLFPYVRQDDRLVYFFPRPQYSTDAKQDSIEDSALRKKLKKAAFVDQQILEALLRTGDARQWLQSENFNGIYWASSAIHKLNFIQSQVVPRVEVPREQGKDTRIFYIERFYFAKESGLFFLASFENKQGQNRFEAALRFLGEEGIGTDRNVGHGKFEVNTCEPFSFGITPQKNLSFTLGLFCPETSEQVAAAIAPDEAGYGLMKRGGWLSEPYGAWRKRSVYMFQEGSCFASLEASSVYAAGKLVDLRPTEVTPPLEHPVWRCGKTLFLSF